MSPKLHNFVPNFVKSSELAVQTKTTSGVYCESSHIIVTYFVSCFMICVFFAQRVKNELIIGNGTSPTFRSKLQFQKR
jgi:hypothetical protein